MSSSFSPILAALRNKNVAGELRVQSDQRLATLQCCNLGMKHPMQQETAKDLAGLAFYWLVSQLKETNAAR